MASHARHATAELRDIYPDRSGRRHPPRGVRLAGQPSYRRHKSPTTLFRRAREYRARRHGRRILPLLSLSFLSRLTLPRSRSRSLFSFLFCAAIRALAINPLPENHYSAQWRFSRGARRALADAERAKGSGKRRGGRRREIRISRCSSGRRNPESGSSLTGVRREGGERRRGK